MMSTSANVLCGARRDCLGRNVAEATQRVRNEAEGGACGTENTATVVVVFRTSQARNRGRVIEDE